MKLRQLGMRGKIWNKLGLESAWWMQALIGSADRAYGNDVYRCIRTLCDDADCRKLACSEYRVFSQNGEDGVIREVFRRIGTETRSFVEFGIESGVEGNCVYLAKVLGWEGLFIEGDAHHYRQLERKYRYSATVQTANDFVYPSTINQIFSRNNVPTNLDLLSIDIDGNDYWVWEALEGYRPRLVIMEYNSSLNPKQKLVQPYMDTGWDMSQFFGASLGAMVDLARKKGYELVYCELAGINAFFVRADLAHHFERDKILVRSPNYFMRNYQHRPDVHGRRYVDLDARPDA